jgi:Leucine-rich repeat (LRR) protein
MGAYINHTNLVHVTNETRTDGCFEFLGYKDIDDQVIRAIVDNKKIKRIQISYLLPDKAYQIIDEILSLRPDISFRLFDFDDEDKVDISFLLKMPHLKNLWFNCIDFKKNQQKINFDVLARLRLKQFYIECFDLRNYEFIKYLSDDLEELIIIADTMGPGVVFDCAWLLKYVNLKSLWLGKKAKKNLELLSQLPKLKELSLRGIKITDFSFLQKMNLEKLALLWNSNNDLHELAKLKNLHEIELWRINKLDDISFLEDMTNLEIIRLEDLKHVTSLPDLSKLTKLKKIVLNGTGIDMKSLPDSIKPYCASF